MHAMTTALALLFLVAAACMVLAVMAALGRAPAFVARRGALLASGVVLGVAGTAVL